MIKKNEIFAYALAALIIVGFFTILALLVLKPVPQINSEILYLVVGTLIGSFTSVVGYFFGSSAGSKQKTEIISKKNNELNNTR